MATPKAALSSPAIPTILKFITESEREGLERLLRQRIAERAYALFEASERREGNELAHWVQAETEILQRGLEVRESGSWVAITGQLPGIGCEDVQIYVEPNRVLVQASKLCPFENSQSRTQLDKREQVFLIEDLTTEVEPSTASASIRDQELTLMVKKRHPTRAAALGASAG